MEQEKRKGKREGGGGGGSGGVDWAVVKTGGPKRDLQGEENHYSIVFSEQK